MMSSGVSSTILISCRTTDFSRSSSSALKKRMQEDVGQEIDRQRQVLVEDLDVETGVSWW